MSDTPTFPAAAVAAPHGLAAETGRAILAEGGNAIEAMVAMAATMAVVYPHRNGIGGDGFWLVREPGGRVRAIEACGPAGTRATIRRYRDRGCDAVPPRGPDAALTVAGAVGGWQVALDYARSLGGRLPLPALLADAVGFARQGCPVSGSEARCRPKDAEALTAAPGFADAFLADGTFPDAGVVRRAPALAETLAYLADAGLDDFYRGDVGREIAADLERLGSPVIRADLERFHAGMVEPLSLRLADATLYDLPPPAHGLASLLALGIFEHLGIRRIETVEHHHGLVEAAKRAYAIRDRLVIGPDRLGQDPGDVLTPALFEREAQRIDRRRAAPARLAVEDGDAVWMGAIDGDGLAVSCIQSIHQAFGSGCVLPGTGIVWHNRGQSFALQPGAREALEPGRKPLHTPSPAMAVFDDGRVLCYGAASGDAQPQVQAQMFTRYAGGMGPGEAVDAPRWLLGRASGGESATLRVESRFDPSLLHALSTIGHAIEDLGVPHDDALGHAGMVVRHRGGRVEAVHDPRSDGAAAGW